MKSRAQAEKVLTNGQRSKTSQAREKKHISTRTPKKPAPRKPKITRLFYEATLVKIDVDLEEVEQAPPITPILAQAQGGLKSVLNSMRFSSDPGIMQFLKVYDRATELDRSIIPWEAWAIKAKLDCNTLLGSILVAMRQHSQDIVQVIAFSAHPDTVRARVKNAMTPEGHKDRDALDVSLGFAPQPKGATFIKNMMVGSTPTPPDDTPTPPPREQEPDANVLFPDLSETQRLISE